jgi:hypothetical protein
MRLTNLQIDDLEIATCAWVSWFNEERLHGELNDLTPEEIESEYRANLRSSRRERTKRKSLRNTWTDSTLVFRTRR